MGLFGAYGESQTVPYPSKLMRKHMQSGLGKQTMFRIIIGKYKDLYFGTIRPNSFAHGKNCPDF